MKYSFKDRVSKSWTMSKTALSILASEKKLLLVPVFGVIASVVLAILLFEVWLGFSQLTNSTLEHSHHRIANILLIIVSVLTIIGILFEVMYIAVFKDALIIQHILSRFESKKSSYFTDFLQTKKHSGSIAAFGLLKTGIGAIIRLISNLIPGTLGENLFSWLAGTGWNIASYFAIPEIIKNDTYLGPLKATKKSMKIMKSVWGESLIANIGIGLIMSLAFLAVMLLSSAYWVVLGTHHFADTATGASHLFFWAILPPLVLLLPLLLVSSILSLILKTTLYYYATTGKSPKEFNKEILQQVFTSKKARKVFGN